MKRFIAPLLLSCGLVLPAAADTISVLRDNTLTLTQQDGKVTTILIKEGKEHGARGKGNVRRQILQCFNTQYPTRKEK